MYQNYIFDLYGTLLDIRTDEVSDTVWNQFASWLCDQGVSYCGDELKEAYLKEVGKLSTVKTVFKYSEIDLEKVFATLYLRKKPDATKKEIWEAGEMFRKISTVMIAPYQNTFFVLKSLREAGKKIFLLSNAQRIFTWRELEESGLLPYFDDVFISSDEGCKKPDVHFFERLIEKHQLICSESIMIGNDGSTDIIGAKAVGLDACYLKTAISPKEELPICKYVFEDGDIGHVLELIRIEA